MSTRLRRMQDFRFSDSGDFMVDEDDNDLRDTRGENMQSIQQHIAARIQSSKGDWRTSPGLGVSLIRFAGRPNTPEVGAEIQTAVVNELIRGGLFAANEIDVQVFPFNRHHVGVYIVIQPRDGRETMQLLISYSLQDNKVSLRS